MTRQVAEAPEHLGRDAHAPEADRRDLVAGEVGEGADRLAPDARAPPPAPGSRSPMVMTIIRSTDGFTEPADERHLDQRADRHREEHGAGDGERERDEAVERHRRHPAQHHELALGEVDDAGGVVDDVEADADDRVDRPVGQPRDEVLEDELERTSLRRATTNFPSFTVSISKASRSRPLWSVGEKLKTPGGADEALHVLDGGADLLPVGPACLIACTRMRERVVGVAAEGADVLLVPRLVGLLVRGQDRLLRVASAGSASATSEPARREDDALGGGAGRLHVLDVAEAVALEDRDREADLAGVLDDDGLGRLDGPVEDRLDVRPPSAWSPRR